jgi:hypothetical protein
MAITPIIKKRGSGGGVTTKSLKPNVFNAASRDHEEILIYHPECHDISPFPNGPSNDGVDGGLFITAAVREPEVVESGGGKVVEVVVEEAPDLLSAGAQQKEVVCIFVLAAGQAGVGVGLVVSEASLIGW